MDIRNYDFKNRFPDGNGSDEIITYLRELAAMLATAFEDLHKSVSTLETASAELSSDVAALDNRVAALEESDE